MQPEKDCQTVKYFISLENNHIIWQEKLFQNNKSTYSANVKGIDIFIFLFAS